MRGITMRIKKPLITFVVLVMLAILTVQLASSALPNVFINPFTLESVDADFKIEEDITGTQTITSKIFPLYDPANSRDASEFDVIIAGETAGATVTPSTANDAVTLTSHFLNAGDNSFTLTVTDKTTPADTYTATISATVVATDSAAFFKNASENAPTFAEDAYTSATKQPLDLTSFVDNDGESDALVYAVVSQNPTQVVCSINGANLEYYPVKNFWGAAKCTVSVTDADAQIAATTRAPTRTNPTQTNIMFDVTGVNDVPEYIATAELQNISMEEDTIQEEDLTYYFKDDDGDVLTYTATIADSTKIKNVTFSGNTMTIEPVTDAFGTTTIVVTATDPTPESVSSGNLNIDIKATDGVPTISAFKVNNADVADNGKVTIKEGEAAAFVVTAADPENAGALTYEWKVGETVQTSTTNTFTYTANFTDAGTKVVTLKIKDFTGKETTRTTNIEVTDVSRQFSVKTANPKNTGVLLAPGQSKAFSVELENGQNVAVTYKWELGTTTVSTAQSYTLVAPATGQTQSLKLTISSTEADLKAVTQSWTVETGDTPRSKTGVLKGTITSIAKDKLAAATDVTIERSGVATFDFGSQAVDLRNVIDLDNFIIMENNLVGLDSSQFTTLANKEVTITIRNVAYAEAPNIFVNAGFETDGNLVTAECSGCKVVSATKAPTSSGTVTFTAPGFSTYKVGNAVGETDVPGLKIEEVKIAGKRLDLTSEDGTIVRDIKPGDEIDIDVKVENNFQNTNDPEIQDIDVEYFIIDIDDGDDLEDKESVDDLKPRRSKTVSFDNIKIPSHVEDDKKYEVRIEVSGTDEDNRDYFVVATGYIRIDKEKHDVHIGNFDLSPSNVRCSSTVSADIEIVNHGGEKEEDAKFTLFNKELGLDRTFDFDLDDDPDDSEFDYERDVVFQIPDGIKEGDYPIVLKTYYDKNRFSNTETKTLKIGKCEDQTVSVNAGSDNVKVDVVSDETAVTLDKSRFTGMSDEELLLIVVLGGIALILLVLIGIILLLPRKKKSRKGTVRKRAKQE
jgi:hypothetical protein